MFFLQCERKNYYFRKFGLFFGCSKYRNTWELSSCLSGVTDDPLLLGHLVFGPVIPDNTKYPSSFIFRAKVQDPEGEGTRILRTAGN